MNSPTCQSPKRRSREGSRRPIFALAGVFIDTAKLGQKGQRDRACALSPKGGVDATLEVSTRNRSYWRRGSTWNFLLALTILSRWMAEMLWWSRYGISGLCYRRNSTRESLAYRHKRKAQAAQQSTTRKEVDNVMRPSPQLGPRGADETSHCNSFDVRTSASGAAGGGEGAARSERQPGGTGAAA